ncbi:MAG: SAM-dependent methyltransferase [Nitrosomonas sp.]|nr:SAM-dependent methyltransferase [Nitrosomonas sp.]MDP1950297.1 SAM-dependent methyltransferase [Nitrosomonas sp.]
MVNRIAPGTLYLVPAPLGDGDIAWVIPDAVRTCVAGLGHFVVEHPKTARKFLKQVGCNRPLQEIKMQVLDEHTQPHEILSLLDPLLAGSDVGLLSEAGCPAVADPGAGLVQIAHLKNIKVVPLVGPSSILLALMASGLNGQQFAFHGYLPVKDEARISRILMLEKSSLVDNQTQIFIETPYRNQKLLELLVQTCRDNTHLCIACDITLASEYIATKTVRTWKHALPNINKKPAIFLLYG